MDFAEIVNKRQILSLPLRVPRLHTGGEMDGIGVPLIADGSPDCGDPLFQVSDAFVGEDFYRCGVTLSSLLKKCFVTQFKRLQDVGPELFA